MIPHVEDPRVPGESVARSDQPQVIDVALGIVGGSVGAGLTVLRAAARFPPLRMVWRPSLLPTRWQPAHVVQEIGRRGEHHRPAARQLVNQLLEEVISVVDLDRVIVRIDVQGLVEGVLAEIDLPAIVRESTGSLSSDAVQTARMTSISADEAISRGLDRFLGRTRQPRALADGES